MKKSKKTIKKYTKLVLVVVVIIVGLSFISSTTKAQSGQCTGTITASCGQLGAFGCGFAGCTWTGPFIGGTCSGGTPPNDCSAFPTETFCGYGPGCSWASGGGWNPPVVTFLQDPTGSYLSPINEGPTPQYKQGFFEIGGNLVVDGGGETFLGQVSTVFGNAFFDGPVYVDNFRGEQDVTIREDLSADFVNTKNDVLIADTLIAGGGIEISSVSGSGKFVCSDIDGRLYKCGPPDAIRPGGWVAWNTTGYALTSGGAQDCSDFGYCRRESATVTAGFGSFTVRWGEFEIVDALGLVRVYAIGGGGGGGGGGTGCGGQGKGGSGGGGGGGGEIREFQFNSAADFYEGKTLLIRIGRGAIGGHGGVYASCGQNNRYHGGDNEHNNHTTTFYKTSQTPNEQETEFRAWQEVLAE